MDPNAANWDHCVQQAALSDVGLRRANNQDSMAVVMAGSEEGFQKRGHLFMVADGMGAHAAGELASKLATDVIPLTYHKLVDRPPPEALLHAVQDANRQINSRGQAIDDFRGMGTTMDAMVLLSDGALIAHVGDSRVYRWRDHRLEQMTFDHSLVWELRAAGQISGGEIPSYIPKNIITRSMGPSPEVRVDLEGPFPIRVGDTFLLCSDGLSGPVQDEEIGKILACLSPDEAVRSLVDLANLRGGPDNITVIVVRVTGPLGTQKSASKRPSAGGIKAWSVPPLLWSLMGLFVLFVLIDVVSLVMRNVPGLLVGAIGAVLTGIAAIIRGYAHTGKRELDGRALGKGPYVRIDCKPDGKFVGQLTEIVAQLREAAETDEWSIDWDRFNAHTAQAVKATEQGDYVQAIREHCQAVSFMMGELKSQHGRPVDHKEADNTGDFY